MYPESSIFKTEDGGTTWKRVSPGGIRIGLINARDKDNAFIVAEVESDKYAGNHLLATSDGGSTWESLGLDTKGRIISSVDFVGDKTLWAVVPDETGSDVYVSNDAGNSWKMRRSTVAGSSYSLGNFDIITPGIEAVSASVGWLSGFSINRTVNGGSSWVTQVDGGDDRTKETINISGAGPGIAWLATWVPGHGGGTVVNSTDGGAVWTSHPLTGYSLDPGRSLDATDGRTAWAYGTGQIMRSDDGGIAWKRIFKEEPTILALEAVDDDTAWALDSSQLVSKTDDSGLTWSGHGFPSQMQYLSAVDGYVAWATGTGMRLARTIDGGTSWKSIDFRPEGRDWVGLDSDSAPLISAADAETVAISYGPYPRVWVTTDAGRYWIPLDVPRDIQDGGTSYSISKIEDIATIDSDNVWISTDANDQMGNKRILVLKTADGGGLWDPELDLLPGAVMSVDREAVWGCDVDGRVYRKTLRP